MFIKCRIFFRKKNTSISSHVELVQKMIKVRSVSVPLFVQCIMILKFCHCYHREVRTLTYLYLKMHLKAQQANKRDFDKRICIYPAFFRTRNALTDELIRIFQGQSYRVHILVGI